MFVDFNILNQLGSPSINSNTFANRPAAGQTGRLFVSTDTFEIYRDNGTGWDLIGGPGAGTITGTGTATQVAYFTGAQTIGSSANLFWDNTAGALGINTATPGAELDVHGTGTIAQFNTTAATGNVFLALQRTGTGIWRIGDTYNGGSNYFELHNVILNNNAAEFQAATNKATFSALETYSSGGATGSLFSYTLTVPNGTNFTGPNVIGNVNSALVLNLGGNTTVPNSTRQGLEGNSRINFTGPGTLTVTQGTSTVRAFSALSSVYSFAGTSAGTITHLAGLRVCFPDNIGLGAINITNNYGILINDQTTGTGTVNYTNRWGIYQEASADVNHFAGAILQGTTTNTGFGIYTNSSFRSDTTTYLAALSGGAVIGSTNALSSSALLQLDSTTGGLLIPRLTTTQRNAIVSAAAGLVIYNTTTTALEFYNGTAWTSGGGGISGSGTTNYLPKFTAATTLGDSRFFDNGTVTFLGNGDVNAAPSTGIFSGTGGTGTNIAGAELRIRGGASTGNAAGGPVTFYTSAAGSSGTGVNAATQVAIIDTRGNMGIGVTPIAWTSIDKVLEIGRVGNCIFSGGLNETSITANAYYTAPSWKYGATGAANIFSVGYGSNSFVWRTAASGTGGAAITFTEVMTLNASGNLGIGTTTIGSRLQVNGNAAIGYSASTAAPTNGLAVSGNAGFGTNSSGNFNGVSFTGPFVDVAGILQVKGTSANTIAAIQLGGDTFRKAVLATTIGTEDPAFTIGVSTSGSSSIGAERFRINSSGVLFVGNGETASTPNTGIISGTGGTGTNIAGAEFRIRGGASTGNAAGGVITFYTSAAGGAGSGVNAAAERLRISDTACTFADAINIAFNTSTGTKIGTATSQKLSFWNATPIVQPTTAVAGAARVGGGGATVTDTDTFGGYTIAQVVQALRNTGILA